MMSYVRDVHTNEVDPKKHLGIKHTLDFLNLDPTMYTGVGVYLVTIENWCL